jgi:ribosomal protein S18 acetylase RimI-like enzyme
MPDTTVRAAVASDFTPLSQSLARAFLTDPVFRFLAPNGDDAARLKKLEAVMGIFFKLGLPHGACYTTTHYESVTLWRPPNEWDVPFWAYVTNGPALLSAFGGGVFRALAVADMMEKVHPHEPHWYLQTIGTDPAFQGKGYGGVIMRDRLAAVDAAHMPCYLESSKDTNIPIYQSFGFELTGEMQVPNGGPKIWPMWRKPR